MISPAHCCYCLTSDIECNSLESKKAGLSGSLNIKVVGLSGSNENIKSIDYSLIEIHCKECNRTYVIQWKKSDYEKMNAMVENALNNMTYSEKNYFVRKVNRAGLNVDEINQLYQFCTKIRARSARETIHHIFLKKDKKRYLLVIRKKKSGIKIVDCVVQRSVYE